MEYTISGDEEYILLATNTRKVSDFKISKLMSRIGGILILRNIMCIISLPKPRPP